MPLLSSTSRFIHALVGHHLVARASSATRSSLPRVDPARQWVDPVCRRGFRPSLGHRLTLLRYSSWQHMVAGERRRQRRPLPPSSTSAPAPGDPRTPAEARRRRHRCRSEVGRRRRRPRSVASPCCLSVAGAHEPGSSLPLSGLGADAALVASRVTRVESLPVSPPTCAREQCY